MNLQHLRIVFKTGSAEELGRTYQKMMINGNKHIKYIIIL